jgi:hypothetical protein
MREGNRFIVYLEDGDGEEDQALSFDFPLVWQICGQCRGEGTSCAYLGSYTSSEMDEAGQEFREDYMNGVYDKPCPECKGSGKVQEIDWDKLTPDQQKMVIDDAEAEAQYQAEIDAERRAGC